MFTQQTVCFELKEIKLTRDFFTIFIQPLELKKIDQFALQISIIHSSALI